MAQAVSLIRTQPISRASTKTGLVCEEGRMRSATQLLRSTWASNDTDRIAPSAGISWRATALPFTTSSSGTLRESPMRARSRSH